MANNNFETEYWNSVAPYKSKYEFIKLHILIDVTETINMLKKAKELGEQKIVLDVMTKRQTLTSSMPREVFQKIKLTMLKMLTYLEPKQNKTYHFNKGEFTLPFFFNL